MGLLPIWATKHSTYSGLIYRKRPCHLPTQPSELGPSELSPASPPQYLLWQEATSPVGRAEPGPGGQLDSLLPLGQGESRDPRLTIPSPSRLTPATTSCLLKRRSVCSSWRRPLAPWRPRLTVDCPQTSQSQPPVLGASEHHPSPSRLPRVRDHLGRQSSDQCLLLNVCHLVCPLLQAFRQKEPRSLPARLNSYLRVGGDS